MHFISDERTYDIVHLIKFVGNMENEILGSNYPYMSSLYVKKDVLQKVRTINNLSLFLKKLCDCLTIQR